MTNDEIANDVARVVGALQTVDPASRMTVLTVALLGEGTRLGMKPEEITLAFDRLRNVVLMFGPYEEPK